MLLNYSSYETITEYKLLEIINQVKNDKMQFLAHINKDMAIEEYLKIL